MKKYHPELFNEMKRTASNIAAAWLLTRKDGVKFGFTSHDQGFMLGGVYYSPTNSFSGSASVSRNNLSVDNMTVLALVGDQITDADLRGGVYENAKVELFWCCPAHPEWGRLDIRGGSLGEIKIKGLQYEAELRSASQKLQQPFGRIYTTECDTTLGSSRCGVRMTAEDWKPSTAYAARLEGEGVVGSIVKPPVYNGLWYECVAGASGVSTNTKPENLPTGFAAIIARLAENKGSAFAALFAGMFGDKKGSLGLGGIVNDPTLTISYGNSGTVEPAWPTAIGGTVADGQLTWRAIQAREMLGTVTSVYNRARFEVANLAQIADRYFQYGLLTWTSGENEGFQMEVRQHRNGVVAHFDLLEAMPFAVNKGDTFTVTPGCPGTRPACKAWNNIYNFQGFPDMPTEDKALATPNYSSQGEQEDSGGKK